MISSDNNEVMIPAPPPLGETFAADYQSSENGVRDSLGVFVVKTQDTKHRYKQG